MRSSSTNILSSFSKKLRRTLMILVAAGCCRGLALPSGWFRPTKSFLGVQWNYMELFRKSFHMCGIPSICIHPCIRWGGAFNHFHMSVGQESEIFELDIKLEASQQRASGGCQLKGKLLGGVCVPGKAWATEERRTGKRQGWCSFWACAWCFENLWNRLGMRQGSGSSSLSLGQFQTRSILFTQLVLLSPFPCRPWASANSTPSTAAGIFQMKSLMKPTESKDAIGLEAHPKSSQADKEQSGEERSCKIAEIGKAMCEVCRYALVCCMLQRWKSSFLSDREQLEDAQQHFWDWFCQRKAVLQQILMYFGTDQELRQLEAAERPAAPLWTCWPLKLHIAS